MQDRRSAFGPFLLDHARRSLTRNKQPIPINNHGYVILATLLEARGEPVSKHTLMERTWPNIVVEEGNLTVQISQLRRQLGEDADALLVTVPRVGYRLVGSPAFQNDAASANFPLVAVLPFANHGDLHEDGYFVDGVVEDIITALSRFKTFAVVSRGSSFALKNAGTDLRLAAHELGVGYALQGSIRRLTGHLIVTAQLIDTRNNLPLWRERYEGVIADIFSFQDRITEGVVGVVEPTIRKAEIERARRKPASDLGAYDLFLEALPLIYKPLPDGHAAALSLLERSATLDPTFALPLAYAAWLYEKRISSRLPSLGNSDLDNAVALARRALELGNDDPLVRAMAGFVLYRMSNDVSALEGVRQAVRDNPNNVVVLNFGGISNQMSGAADEAYACRAKAYALSPGAPDTYMSLHGMGAAEMMRGNHELAVDWCRKSLATFNEWPFAYITLTAAYANLGKMEEARAAVRKLRELSPHLSLAAFEGGVAPCIDAYGLAVIPALRVAGLPER